MKYFLHLLLYLASFALMPQVKSQSDSISFTLTRFNNMAVNSILNDRDTLQLMFHLANGGVSITETAAEQLSSIKWNLTDSVGSWGGMSESQFSEYNQLSIGNTHWDSLQLSSCLYSGRETDGKFGPNLFGNQILEINFDLSLIIIHDSLPEGIIKSEKINIQHQGSLLFLEATAIIDEEKLNNRFLIHSGYSSSLLFDDEFASKHKMGNKLPLLSESELLDSYGNRLKTKKSQLHQFKIGSFSFENIPVSFFEGAIGRQKMSVLGMDVLKRFNLVFDPDNQVVYLQKNSLFNTPYHEG